MLKHCAIYLLIAALICSSFQWMFVCAGFQVNKQYIAATLCVNRSKPWLHCNGKCYFMRKLKQAEEKEKNDESQTQKNLLQEAFCSFPARVKFHTAVLQTFAVPNGRIKLPRVTYPVLRPPQLG